MEVNLHSSSTEIIHISEYIKNRLYFATIYGKAPKSTPEVHFFCTDEDLVYYNYYSDFGPLNLSCIYKYCCLLNEKIKKLPEIVKIVHYTSPDLNKRANAALLVACFGVLYDAMSPTEAFQPLKTRGTAFKPFQDASQHNSIYHISISDCLQAIHRAVTLRFFNFMDFDCVEFDRLSRLGCGDISWIVPGKFLAFPGPTEGPTSEHNPEFYFKYFLENNVGTVIRLNSPQYNAEKFTKIGIAHYDLFFPDGTTPPRSILVNFLNISESADGAIAIHCKAGLGRTGTLIGAYLIKHYDMGAREAIAWMRLCRPGCVIGQQQAFLEQSEAWLWKEGCAYRVRNHGEGDKLPCHRYGIYSLARKIRASMHKDDRQVAFASTKTGSAKRCTSPDDADVNARIFSSPKTQEHSPTTVKQSMVESADDETCTDDDDTVRTPISVAVPEAGLTGTIKRECCSRRRSMLEATPKQLVQLYYRNAPVRHLITSEDSQYLPNTFSHCSRKRDSKLIKNLSQKVTSKAPKQSSTSKAMECKQQFIAALANQTSNGIRELEWAFQAEGAQQGTRLMEIKKQQQRSMSAQHKETEMPTSLSSERTAKYKR